MCDGCYVPLHVHSYYSLLDGLPSPYKIAERAKEIGAPACAITDHGSLFGMYAHWKACQKFGIKPIIGCELYICEHDPSIQATSNNKRNHLTILAKSQEGVQTLQNLVSATNKPEWFYRKPRIDLENLKNFTSNNDLLCLSGCLAGELTESLFTNLNEACLTGADFNNIDYVRSLLVNDWQKKSEQIILKYQKIFGKDNYYIELQEEGMVAQKVAVECLRQAAEALDVPSVATLDAHYARKEDAEDQRILLCSQLHTTTEQQDQKKKQGGDTMAFFYLDEFYIFDYNEMSQHYTQKEIEASLEINDKIKTISLKKRPCLPKFNNEEKHKLKIESGDYLKHLCLEQAKKKFSERSKEERLKYWKRLERELAVINEAGLSDYFLIVWDFCNFIDENKGPRGKGRGSGAGSLVNYLLNITKIDPIENDLFFERFYNVSRNIPPHFNFNSISFMEWLSKNVESEDDRSLDTCKESIRKTIKNKGLFINEKWFKNKLKQEADWIDEHCPKMWFYIYDIIHYYNKDNVVEKTNISNSAMAFVLGQTSMLDKESPFIARDGHTSLPDIDIDVGINFRQKVIDYLSDRWGHKHVGQMVTFGRLQGKAALKEVFKIQSELAKHLIKVRAVKKKEDISNINISPFDTCNEITQYIPDEASISDEIQEMKESNEGYGILNWAIDNVPQVSEAYKWYKPLFDQAIRIEGTKKSQSRHAAGVVIADTNIEDLVPLVYDSQNKNRIVGVEMFDAENMGAVKFDILGITALDKCAYCEDLINGLQSE